MWEKDHVCDGTIKSDESAEEEGISALDAGR